MVTLPPFVFISSYNLKGHGHLDILQNTALVYCINDIPLIWLAEQVDEDLKRQFYSQGRKINPVKT